MVVKEFSKLIQRISDKLGTDDESLALLEDITDTFKSFEGAEDWQKKYEELDNFWRERYKKRFVEVKDIGEDATLVPEENGEIRVKTFEELFKEVE